jgi:hypothetical protein
MHRRKPNGAARRLRWGLGLSQATGMHRSHLPIDELKIIAEAVQRFLDSDGNRHAMEISTNSMKRSIAWKPTRISSQTDSTGKNLTANCER